MVFLKNVFLIEHRNPVGRTGISGRGCLGRWGPNHAADPIVTRLVLENATINMK